MKEQKSPTQHLKPCRKRKSWAGIVHWYQGNGQLAPVIPSVFKVSHLFTAYQWRSVKYAFVAFKKEEPVNVSDKPPGAGLWRCCAALLSKWKKTLIRQTDTSHPWDGFLLFLRSLVVSPCNTATDSTEAHSLYTQHLKDHKGQWRRSQSMLLAEAGYVSNDRGCRHTSVVKQVCWVPTCSCQIYIYVMPSILSARLTIQIIQIF